MKKFEFKKILTPKTLPNNLNTIRSVMGLSKKELSEIIEIGVIYIQEIEKGSKTFSGKKTIEVLTKLDQTFASLYSKDEVKTLPCVDWYEMQNQTFYVLQSENKNENLNTEETSFIKKEIKRAAVLPNEKYRSLDKLEVINYGLGKSLKEFIKDNKIEVNVEDDQFYKIVNIEYKTIREVEKEKEFDLNLTKNYDKELLKKLYDRPFKTTALRQRFAYNDPETFVEKREDTFVFKEPVEIAILKMVDGKKEYDYETITEIHEDHPSIHVSEDDHFTLLIKGEELNHLEFIEEEYKADAADIAKSLGVTVENYNNMKKGNQKIATFTMWKMVRYFEVPLEYLINIPQYFKLYLHEG